jgi:hypothetical protein
LGDLKIGRQIIHTLKYADYLVLLAKEGKVLQDMIDKLIEIGRCYGIEMNAEKTKVMRISIQTLPVKIIIDQKQLENVESFKYLGRILKQMMENVLVKLSAGLLWLNLHSTRRGLFLLAHWTWN